MSKKISSKNFVLSKMPKAVIEKHKSGIIGGLPYWLIRNGREYMYFVCSEISAKDAWDKAKERIELIDKSK